MKLNDLVSFVRFSLNNSPHVKTSRPINRLSLFPANAQCRSIDRIVQCNFLIQQTPNFTVSLTWKLELSLNVTYYPPPALWQKQAYKKSKFKIAPCKTSICDQWVCKVLIHLKQNCRGSLQHKITGILLADVHKDGHTDKQADWTIPPTA